MPPIPVLAQLFSSPTFVLYSLTLDLDHLAFMGDPLTLQFKEPFQLAYLTFK